MTELSKVHFIWGLVFFGLMVAQLHDRTTFSDGTEYQ
jgi:hypothetical protein